MSKKVATGSWIAAIVVLLAVVVAGVFLARKAIHPDQPVVAVPATTATVATNTANVPVQHPIAQAQVPAASASTVALPALDQSDDEVASALQQLTGSSQLSLLLVRPQIIARIVATIDAMPGRSLGGLMLPARTPKGAFVTRDADGNTVIGEDNAARYAPYMAIVEQVDPQALVAWYVHAYPLFQQAYRQLGYPKGYFNDRLIVVIDNLLAAPEPVTPPALRRSNGHFIYADPGLEALSAGQRLLLRTGPANEASIKAKLRAIRTLLAGQHLRPASAGTAK
ncbi:MAG TPA: DUF3014 domain-containing protein [Rhodanobacter sp.]|nr:DUF3014 domain-containing protein [Rhodanobacter sp.]